MFINNSTDIRDTFSFAKPDQILKATSLYCCHLYGAMLWDISGEMCGQFCRCWNTAVKLAWQVPWGTHTYLVNNVLGVQHTSIEEQILVRFVKFFKKLRESKSEKIQLLANIVGKRHKVNYWQEPEHHCYKNRIGITDLIDSLCCS